MYGVLPVIVPVVDEPVVVVRPQGDDHDPRVGQGRVQVRHVDRVQGEGLGQPALPPHAVEGSCHAPH